MDVKFWRFQSCFCEALLRFFFKPLSALDRFLSLDTTHKAHRSSNFPRSTVKKPNIYFFISPKWETADVKCGLWLSCLRMSLRLRPDGSRELWLSGPRESPWPKGLADTTPCPFWKLLSIQKSCGSFATANNPGERFLVLGDGLQCFVYRKTLFCRIDEVTQFVNFHLCLNCFTEESKPLFLAFSLCLHLGIQISWF